MHTVTEIIRSLSSIRRAFAVPLLLLAMFPGHAVFASETEAGGDNSPAGRSRTDDGNTRDKYKISVKVSLVATDVRVIGPGTTELHADDFLIYDNGIPQEIAAFSYDQLPIDVALLIDRSGSVQQYFPLLQIAALLSLKNLKPEDRVALFSFAESWVMYNELSMDRLLIARNISRIGGGGETRIFNALCETTRYLLEKGGSRRRAIILFSDNCGDLNSSKVKKTIGEVLEASATLYSIQTPGNTYGTSRWEINRIRNRVKEIVDSSGGELLEVDASMSPQEALVKAIENIRYRYTLGFYPSDPGNPGSYHSLDVQFRNQDRCPRCRIVTREGYYAGIHAPASDDETPQAPETVSENTDDLLIQRVILTAGASKLELPDIPFTVATVERATANEKMENSRQESGGGIHAPGRL